MTAIPSKAVAAQRVFELRPLVSEDFDGRQCTRTLRISSEELARMRRAPLASEEFRIRPDAPVLCVVGRSSDGFLLAAVVEHQPAPTETGT